MEMSDLSENQLIELITEAAIRLLQTPNSIPQLLNLLDEVEFLLRMVGQAPSQLMQKALLLPMKALISDALFRHSDPDVRITIASCLAEVTRITAPIPPYEDDKMREIFELIVSSFENLSCQPGRCYSKAVLIIQSVARLQSCVMMLDLDCDPLVTKMFELFLGSISAKHPHAVHLSMVNIMRVMIEESDYVHTELVKALLTSIRRENLAVSPASWELSAKILEGCANKLRPFILETVSSMGYCLEDYAPILLSICKPESDPNPITVTNVTNDSSFLVHDEPSGYPSHQVPYVQALEAATSVGCVNACRSAGIASEERKQSSQNVDEESPGLHLVGDKPSGNLFHPAEYVQALETTESFCVNALETGGTAPIKGRDSKFQNLDEKAIALACEHDFQGTADFDISKNNGVLGKELDIKRVKEEANGFENQQKYDSCALVNNKRRRGRPRKKDVEQRESLCGSGNKVNDKPPGNLSHPAESVQNLKEAESLQCGDVLGTGGTVTKEGRSPRSQNLEVTGLECERYHQGTADDVSNKIDIPRADLNFKRVKEEAVDFDNKQLCNSSTLGDNKRKRGRPRKKAVEQQEFSGGFASKVIETHGRTINEEDLVGRRIKVWWPLDNRYYKGTITLFDASARKHQVTYDDEDEEVLNLRKERWEFI